MPSPTGLGLKAASRWAELRAWHRIAAPRGSRLLLAWGKDPVNTHSYASSQHLLIRGQTPLQAGRARAPEEFAHPEIQTGVSHRCGLKGQLREPLPRPEGMLCVTPR